MSLKRSTLVTLISIICNERGNVFVGGGDASTANASGSSESTDSGTTTASSTGDGGAGGGEGSSNSTDQSSSTVNYPEGMDEGLKNHPAFNAFIADGKINYANIMKSYVHQQKMLGKEKMLIPNSDFTEDQWKETFHKLGVPKDIKEYNIKMNIPENIKLDETVFNNFKELAFNKGLLPQQAQEVSDFYHKTIADTVKAQEEASIAAVQAEKENLKKEWGADYEKNLNYADIGLNQFADESIKKYIVDSGLASNTMLQRLFAKVGQSLSAEDNSFNDDTNKDINMSLNDVNDKISKIYTEISKMSKINPDRPAKMKVYHELLSRKMRMSGQDPNQIISAS